jgi:hypothetical protein
MLGTDPNILIQYISNLMYRASLKLCLQYRALALGNYQTVLQQSVNLWQVVYETRRAVSSQETAYIDDIIDVVNSWVRGQSLRKTWPTIAILQRWQSLDCASRDEVIIQNELPAT